MLTGDRSPVAIQESILTVAFFSFLGSVALVMVDSDALMIRKIELTTREKWLQSVYENIPAGVAVWQNDHFSYCNASFQRLQKKFNQDNPFESMMDNQHKTIDEEVWLEDNNENHFAYRVSLFPMEAGAMVAIIATDVSDNKAQQHFIHSIASKIDKKGTDALDGILDTLSSFLPGSFIYIGRYHETNLRLHYLSHRGDQVGLHTSMNYDIDESPFKEPNTWVWLTQKNIRQYEKDPFIARFSPKTIGGVLLTNSKNQPLGLVVVMQRKHEVIAPLIIDFLSLFTHRVRAELEQLEFQNILQHSEDRYRAFITRSQEAIAHIDLHPPIRVEHDVDVQWLQFEKAGRLKEVNPAFSELFHFPANAGMDALLKIKSLKHVIRYTFESGYGTETLEVPHEDNDGNMRWLSCTSMGALEDGRLMRIWLIMRDITESKTHIEHLEYQASHDVLTGLPNRTAIRDCLDEKIEQANQFGFQVALLLIDLDRFKEINDTLGHHYGDVLLKKIAPRINPLLMLSHSVLGRLGGDEFAVIMPSMPNQQEAMELALLIIEQIREPFDLGQMNVEIAGSIGISVFPHHGRDTSTLLRCADIAMYKAKHQAGGILFYANEMDEHSPRRLALMTELGQAIREGQMFLCFQPKVRLSDNKITSAEALIRWRHPEHGLMPPGEFIPLAEVTDLIIPITEWVIKNAIIQIKRWLDQGLDIRVAVNVSTRNLLDENLIDFIRSSLEESNLPPDYLEIEITESALMADPEHALDTLNKISELGVALAVDDFGTGYSSLAYLRQLPIDALKIDLMFVSHMCQNPQDEIIVSAIVNLSKNLSLVVVAEGVEDVETMNRLRDMGCDAAQGYYMSAPLNSEQFEDFYQRWHGESE